MHDTARDILAKVNAETAKYLTSPEGRSVMGSQGLEVVAGTPESFARNIQAETARWAAVVKAGNIRID